MSQYTISVSSISALVEIVAGLVMQGICFNVEEDGSRWIVRMTGGY
jgi:hypothetical protein